MFNKLCPTCQRREVVIDNGCAICLFFRSPEEQDRFQRIIQRIFDLIPEALGYSIERQTKMVIQALPYTCVYKAQYLKELHYFIAKVLEQNMQCHMVEADSEIPILFNEVV